MDPAIKMIKAATTTPAIEGRQLAEHLPPANFPRLRIYPFILSSHNANWSLNFGYPPFFCFFGWSSALWTLPPLLCAWPSHCAAKKHNLCRSARRRAIQTDKQSNRLTTGRHRTKHLSTSIHSTRQPSTPIAAEVNGPPRPPACRRWRHPANLSLSHPAFHLCSQSTIQVATHTTSYSNIKLCQTDSQPAKQSSLYQLLHIKDWNTRLFCFV